MKSDILKLSRIMKIIIFPEIHILLKFIHYYLHKFMNVHVLKIDDNNMFLIIE